MYDKSTDRYILDYTILQPLSITCRVFNWFYANRHKGYPLEEIADMLRCTRHQIYIAIYRINHLQNDFKIEQTAGSDRHYIWRG